MTSTCTIRQQRFRTTIRGRDTRPRRIIGDRCRRLALYQELTKPGEVFLAEVVVQRRWRGRGVGEALVRRMAEHVATRLPSRHKIGLQILRDDEFDRRRAWFASFGFAESQLDDETCGVWFAPVAQVKHGRVRA